MAKAKKISNKTHRNGKGECFQRAYHLLIDGIWKGQKVLHYLGKPKLCHGIVWHEKRGYHIHGWIEDAIFAYDFIADRLVIVEKDRYYYLGKIEDKPGHLFRYTADEALEKVVETDRYYFSNLVTEIKVN